MNIILLDNTNSNVITINFKFLALTNIDFITNTITINQQATIASSILMNSKLTINDQKNTILYISS